MTAPLRLLSDVYDRASDRWYSATEWARKSAGWCVCGNPSGRRTACMRGLCVDCNGRTR